MHSCAVLNAEACNHHGRVVEAWASLHAVQGLHWFQFEDTGKAHQNTSQLPDSLLRLIVAEMAYNKHPNVVSKGDLNSLFSASARRPERLKIYSSAQNNI